MLQEDTVTLDKVFSSRGRVKILSLLSKVVELNISEIAKRADLNYTTAERHLRELTFSGIIREKRFGRIRVYMLKEYGQAQLIRSFITLWENHDRSPSTS